MKQNVFLVLCGILIGCAGMSAERGGAVGSANADVPAPAHRYAPNPAAPKWEQYCGEVVALNAAANEILAARGREGWELAQVVNQGQFNNPTWICFKRPAPP